jgi:hypothetical protein
MDTSSFQITDAESFFFTMVLPQYQDFVSQNSCVRSALLTTILAYHLYEWANPKENFSVDRFISRYPEHKELAKYFEMARDITNGLKHFKVKPTTTRSQSGFSSAFSNGFSRPLIIIAACGEEISVDEFLAKIIGFWEEKIKLKA